MIMKRVMAPRERHFKESKLELAFTCEVESHTWGKEVTYIHYIRVNQLRTWRKAKQVIIRVGLSYKPRGFATIQQRICTQET